MQRNLRTCNRDIKLQCYKTYVVRPIVEYASPARDTSNKMSCKRLKVFKEKQPDLF